MDLLDLALSADTVNTVKNLRLIIESGVEPMALMSQIATVITDILAGSYDFKKERPRRKFFRRQPCKSKNIYIICDDFVLSKIKFRWFMCFPILNVKDLH